MCHSYERNRADLADLIYLLEDFSEEELISEFRKSSTDLAIDGHQTVGGYLEDLTALGGLDRIGDRYVVVRETAPSR